MTTAQERAELLLKEFESYCDKAVIVSATDKLMQFNVWRKSEMSKSALFAEDETEVRPFDDWAVRQTIIQWRSGAPGRFWIGYIGTTRVVFKVEA